MFRWFLLVPLQKEKYDDVNFAEQHQKSGISILYVGQVVCI